MVIQLGSSIILARLLVPEEIGIFSVALSFITLGHMLRDFGIGEYLIQEKELTSEKIRSGFTLSLILAWILATIIYFISGPLASFYEEEGIAQVLPVIALNFLLIPFGAITISLLRREMRFDQLIKINLSSAFINASAAIFLAMNGYSFMSLAWAAIAGTATSVLVSQFYRPKALSFLPTLSKAKAIIAYGSYNTLTNFTSNIATTAPDLILGKMLGMHLVGIFNRGNSLLQMLTQLITGGVRPILLPYFSEQHRNNSQELASIYIKMTDALLAVLWPVMAFLIVYAHETILFLFGENWLEAVPVVQVLGIGTSIWLTASFASELFKATNNIKLLAKITFFMSFVRVIAILVGSYFSFKMVLILFAATSILHGIVVFHMLRQVISIQLKDIVNISSKNLMMTIIIIIPTLLTKLTDVQSAFLTLIFSGTIFTIGWFICLYTFHRPLLEKIIGKK
jgi:O-antigen/teichoic acid export membrane protein